MQTDFSIRAANLEDIVELRQLSIDTFLEAFGSTTLPENMDQYVSRNFSISKLTDEVDNPLSHFYLAHSKGTLAGYLKVNMGTAQTEPHDDDHLEIERIYVQGTMQSMGIGQRLFETAIDIARQYHKSWIWLGVHESNVRAIAFYKKFGMVKYGEHSFILGDDRQVDILMHMSLSE